jgi:chlorobactene glucosyltransferase
MSWIVSVLLVYFAAMFLLNLHYFAPRSNRNRPFRIVVGNDKISVLIPVRNEEKNIAACLDSLLLQNHENFEILVMDDHSQDGSWEILTRYQAEHHDMIRAYRSEPLPDGWSGKNWVCHQLSQLADGSWLLFTDADTIHGKDSLRNAIKESLVREADLVSYLPDLITVSLIEKIVIPVIYFSFYFLFPMAMMDLTGNRYAAAAIGTFILVKSSTYKRIGGHHALRDEIVEDMHLARLVKGDGKKVALLDGAGLLSTRFYTDAGQIWRGFTKSTFGAFGYSVLPCILTLAVCYGIFLNPFIQLVLAPVASFANPFFGQVVAIIGLRLALALRTRHSILSVVFHPVMICFSLGFALNSVRKMMLREPVTWKGRQYRTVK